MDPRTLTTDQARQVRDAIQPHLRYLLRLCQRLDAVGFLPSDPLRQRVAAAYDAMYSLFVELHYQSCKTGVGRPPHE